MATNPTGQGQTALSTTASSGAPQAQLRQIATTNASIVNSSSSNSVTLVTVSSAQGQMQPLLINNQPVVLATQQGQGLPGTRIVSRSVPLLMSQNNGSPMSVIQVQSAGSTGSMANNGANSVNATAQIMVKPTIVRPTLTQQQQIQPRQQVSASTNQTSIESDLAKLSQLIPSTFQKSNQPNQARNLLLAAATPKIMTVQKHQQVGRTKGGATITAVGGPIQQQNRITNNGFAKGPVNYNNNNSNNQYQSSSIGRGENQVVFRSSPMHLQRQNINQLRPRSVPPPNGMIQQRPQRPISVQSTVGGAPAGQHPIHNYNRTPNNGMPMSTGRIQQPVLNVRPGFVTSSINNQRGSQSQNRPNLQIPQQQQKKPPLAQQERPEIPQVKQEITEDSEVIPISITVGSSSGQQQNGQAMLCKKMKTDHPPQQAGHVSSPAVGVAGQLSGAVLNQQPSNQISRSNSSPMTRTFPSPSTTNIRGNVALPSRSSYGVAVTTSPNSTLSSSSSSLNGAMQIKPRRSRQECLKKKRQNAILALKATGQSMLTTPAQQTPSGIAASRATTSGQALSNEVSLVASAPRTAGPSTRKSNLVNNTINKSLARKAPITSSLDNVEAAKKAAKKKSSTHDVDIVDKYDWDSALNPFEGPFPEDPAPMKSRVKNLFKLNETPDSELHDPMCWYCHSRVIESEAVYCDGCHLSFHKQRCASYGFRLVKLRPEKKKKNYVSFSAKKKSRKQVKKESSDSSMVEIPYWKVMEQKLTVMGQHSAMSRRLCNECISMEIGYYYNLEEERHGMLSGGDKPPQNTAWIFSYTLNTLKEKVFGAGNPYLWDMECMVERKGWNIWRDHPRRKWVYRKMDLKTMTKKARAFAYTSVEQFMFDIKTIEHNIMILYPEHKNTWHEHLNVLKRYCEGEVKDISQCDICYRNYYEITETESFNVPCNHLHGLVWVFRNDKWWPGKVFHYRDERSYVYNEDYAYVKIFGDTLTTHTVPIKDLYTYAKNPPAHTLPIKTRNKDPTPASYAESIHDLSTYLDSLEFYYENVTPAIEETPKKFNPENGFYWTGKLRQNSPGNQPKAQQPKQRNFGIPANPKYDFYPTRNQIIDAFPLPRGKPKDENENLTNSASNDSASVQNVSGPSSSGSSEEVNNEVKLRPVIPKTPKPQKRLQKAKLVKLPKSNVPKPMARYFRKEARERIINLTKYNLVSINPHENLLMKLWNEVNGEGTKLILEINEAQAQLKELQDCKNLLNAAKEKYERVKEQVMFFKKHTWCHNCREMVTNEVFGKGDEIFCSEPCRSGFESTNPPSSA